MDKRTFLKLMGHGTLATLATTGLNACGKKVETVEETVVKGPKPGMPDNWIWLRPQTGLPDDKWKRMFGTMAENGIEAVLPQIFNSTTALFDLPDFTVEEPLLERLIPLAHAAGLQIHAWMWTMPCNNQKIIEQHPDWYAVNGNGEPAHTHPAYVDYYKFLCPCHPEVQDFIQARVRALAKIEDLDGIHLDYVRLPDVILAEGLQPKYDLVQDREFPEFDYSYSSNCREQFKAQSGIDPLTLENPAEHEAWRQFRYDSVSNLVNGKLVPVAREHGKKITAAVFPNWESVRQQWHRWDLDAFLPMLYQGFYNADIEWIKTQTENGLQRLNHSKPIYSGLFIPHLNPDELEKAISVAKSGGAKGVSLFGYNEMTTEHWAKLKEVLVG